MYYMKKIGLYNVLLVSVLLVLSMMMVSAADTITLINPAQDASISGSTYILNATLDSNTLNLTSAEFFYDDGSSNTSIAIVTNVTNTLFNTTWDTTAINDVDDLTVWVNVTDYVGAAETMDSSTGVDIDNGNPTAGFSSATIHNNAQKYETQIFTIGLAADNTIGISSCIIFLTDRDTSSVTSATTTTSANACSNTTLSPSALSLVAGHGYNFLVQATDGNGDQTNSSSRIIGFVVQEDGSLVSQPSRFGGDNMLGSLISWFRNLLDKIRNIF